MPGHPIGNETLARLDAILDAFRTHHPDEYWFTDLGAVEDAAEALIEACDLAILRRGIDEANITEEPGDDYDPWSRVIP